MRKVILFVFSIILIVNIVYSQEYVLLGWNDLGMHCTSLDFSKVSVLPPFNNVYAQLVMKGKSGKPKVVTENILIEYSIPGNSYSAGKTNFWLYAKQIFGLKEDLPENIGLKGKGLSGNMDAKSGYFVAEGIPVTPFQDSDWKDAKPYQLIHLIAKDATTNEILAFTDVTIPVAAEDGCVNTGCHVSEQAILDGHKPVEGFNKNGPVLCGTCHGTAALGTVGDTVNAKLFSYRIHSKHKFIESTSSTNQISTCYNCHPGGKTNCYRDVMSIDKNNPLICQDCHGNLEKHSSSVLTGRRPWLDEPKCGNKDCHGEKYAENEGKLFRESKGHGKLFCSACHGSTHAIVPSREENDNLQNIRLQGFAGALGKCSVCHDPVFKLNGPHGFKPKEE